MSKITGAARPRYRFWGVLLLGALTALPLAAQTEPMPGDYRVEGGQVDPGTYTGWRLFHSACYGCHGVGALGTDLAPNLVQRVKTMTPRDFVTKVLTSYRIVQPLDGASPGDRGTARDATIDEIMRRQRASHVRIIMPAWDVDPLVNPHVLDLFAYLTARADGKLGPGEPTVLTKPGR